jgi:hypothetical protein
MSWTEPSDFKSLLEELRTLPGLGQGWALRGSIQLKVAPASFEPSSVQGGMMKEYWAALTHHLERISGTILGVASEGHSCDGHRPLPSQL